MSSSSRYPNLKSSTPPVSSSAVEKMPTKIQKLVGGFVWGLFVGVWISSILSPFLFILFVMKECYGSATWIAVVTLLAYLPLPLSWEKHDNKTKNIIRACLTKYSSFHFPSVHIIIEEQKQQGGTDEGSRQQQQQQLQNDVSTFYGIHPHGTFCIGWALLYSHQIMNHVRFCFAPALFSSPIFRLFTRITGKPGSAAKSKMRGYMLKNESIALPPGGFEEATVSSTHQDRVYIKKRTGFVKLCLECGVESIRPVYVFGEKSLYWNIQGLWSTRFRLNRYGLPTILPWGLFCLPLVPKNTAPLTIVIGRAIILPPKATNIHHRLPPPTKEEVCVWHDKYMLSLTRIFEEYKEIAYGPEGKTMKLEVW